MILPSKGEGNQNAGPGKEERGGKGEEVEKRNGSRIRSEEMVVLSAR